MAKKPKSTDLVRMARMTRDVGRVVAREMSARSQASAGHRWRADQVERHRAAVRQVQRHERRIRRADRALVRSGAVAGTGIVVAVAALAGGWGAIYVLLAVVATAAAAARAVHWRNERVRVRALPAPPPPPPLPPPTVLASQTWPCVARLDRAVRSWDQLEPLLVAVGTIRYDTRTGSPGDVLEQIASANQVAALARDEINARIAAVQSLEAAAATAPPAAAEHLRWGVAEGLAELDAALVAYEDLVAAASAAVVAGGVLGATVPVGGSATGATGASAHGIRGPNRLGEATEALAGLAYGLRELRYRPG